MEMLHMWMAHGILFADIEIAIANKEEVLGKCPVKWRLTFGGKVLAVELLGECASMYLGEPIIPIEFNKVWQWPVVPMWHVTYSAWVVDCWATATARTVADKENVKRIEAEANPRSRKLNHRVVWADRKRSRFVTDPLLRREFASLGEVVDRLARLKQMYYNKQEWKDVYG
jgi:hypothetical protein